MWSILRPAGTRHDSEPRLAYPSTGQQSHMIPYKCTEYGRGRADNAIAANLDAWTNNSIRPDECAGTDHGARCDGSTRCDLNALVYRGIGRNGRLTMPIQMTWTKQFYRSCSVNIAGKL